MSKQTPNTNDSDFERSKRLSLQPKSTKDVPDSSFRHTQSQRYGNMEKKKEKKSVVLTVIPDFVEVTISEDPEPTKKSKSKQNCATDLERRSSKNSKTSKGSRKSEVDKNIYAFQNPAFDDKFDKRSITSSKAGSSRAPSVQSLEIVHEQYCCFAKRTRCERKLIITLAVLILVIIVLIIVIALIAGKGNIRDDLKASFVGL